MAKEKGQRGEAGWRGPEVIGEREMGSFDFVHQPYASVVFADGVGHVGLAACPPLANFGFGGSQTDSTLGCSKRSTIPWVTHSW